MTSTLAERVERAEEPLLHWVPNTGKRPAHLHDESEIVLRFANGSECTTEVRGWHWGMHRRMPGTIIAWAHADGSPDNAAALKAREASGG